LSRWLVGDHEQDRWVPEGASALVQVFPVLGRVEAMRAASRADDAVEPQELRRQAFAALQTLLARVAAAHPLVLWIDDLQWGDLDSEVFLRDLAGGGEAPLLVLLTYRSEDRETSPLLRALAEPPAHDTVRTSGASVRTLALAPLDADDARRLTAHLLPHTEGDADVESIVSQSGGSPFLACELARYLATRGGGTRASAVVELHDVVAARVDQLAATERTLL